MTTKAIIITIHQYSDISPGFRKNDDYDYDYTGDYGESDPSAAYPDSEGSGIFPGSEASPTSEPFPAVTGTVDRRPVSDMQKCIPSSDYKLDCISMCNIAECAVGCIKLKCYFLK